MQLRRIMLHIAAGAMLFSFSAVAQDAGATAGQGGSQDTTSSKKASKKSKGEAGEKKSGGMDMHFVNEAAAGGMAEVSMGNVASSNGSNDAVKQFGQHMVTDHSKANDELKQLAQQKNWTLPSDTDAKHKAKQDRMQNLKGEEFDKAYMRDMVMDHQKDVKAFQKCANSCSDPDLKAWAAKTLPTLQDHLKMAQDTAKQVGAMTAGSKSKGKKGDHDADDKGKPSGAIQ